MSGDVAERAHRSFTFGPFVLVPERQQLLQGEASVRIGGRALDILTALVERPGELVSKRELMERAWPTITVDESNLEVNIAALRRALGDGPGAPEYIATVTGRGYQFVASVQTIGSPGFAPAADEDDGWIISSVYDHERHRSDIVILEAQDFAGEPIATIRLPVRIPFTFHGGWAPDDARTSPVV